MLQRTKGDYAHTFLVRDIDGPALLKVTKEQMIEWKVKAIDAVAILKGVQVSGCSVSPRRFSPCAFKASQCTAAD